MFTQACNVSFCRVFVFEEINHDINIYEIGHISPSRLSRFLSTERSSRTYVVPSLTSVNVGFPASISLNAFSRFSRTIRSLTASLIYLLMFSVLCLRYSIMSLEIVRLTRVYPVAVFIVYQDST